MGSLSLPLSELLVADQLCLDHWFMLSNGPGQVLLRAQLGVSARRQWARGGRAGAEGRVLLAREQKDSACRFLVCLDPGVPALRGGSSQPQLQPQLLISERRTGALGGTPSHHFPSPRAPAAPNTQ